MAEDLGTWLRKNVEGDFKALKKPMNTVFREVIRQPKEVSPQEKFYQFMQMPQEERLMMAQELGREAYTQHLDSMTELGTELIGPAAVHMRSYFDQDLQALEPEPVANPLEQDYASLIDQAMAMELPEFEEE